MAVTAMRDDISRFKRGLILDAAAALFFERGYSLTTTEALAERLSVSKTAIYAQFRSKTEILDTICERAVRRSLDLIESVVVEPVGPAEKIRRLARDLTGIVIDSRDAMEVGRREVSNVSAEAGVRILAMQRRFDRLLADIIRDGIAAGVFDVADPTQAGFAISGMILFTHTWYRPGGRLSPERIADGMAESALRLVLAGTRPAGTMDRNAFGSR
jgi:AcrR family transcriptional regulator